MDPVPDPILPEKILGYSRESNPKPLGRQTCQAANNNNNKFKVNKLKTAYYLTKVTYNKKSISINVKLRHYATVVRPEALHGVECLNLNMKMMMEELAIAERRILRKILGPIKEGDQYRRRHNNELKHIEKITDTIRKRRIAFYGHLQRMNSNRLTGRILNIL